MELSARTEAVVASDAAWALISAGLLPRTAETVRKVCAELHIIPDDLRAASARSETVGRFRKPREDLLVRPEERPSVPSVASLAAHHSPRVFLEHLRDAVDAKPEGTAAAAVAQQVIDSLNEDQRGHLVAWLGSMAPSVVEGEIKRIRATHRAGGHRRKVQSFAERVARYELGDIAALADFSVIYVVAGHQKPLGEMTGADHLTVASGFQQLGMKALMLAAIHRQIARRVGSSTTREVFSSDEYARLLRQPVALSVPTPTLTA